MHREYFILTLIVVVKTDLLSRRCDRLFNGHRSCCKNYLPITGASFDECYEMVNRAGWCDQELCFAEKLNFATIDGSIDMKSFMKFIETAFEDPFNPFEDRSALVKSIKDECASGNLTKYGREEECDVVKLQLCTKVQYLKKCTSWDNVRYCKGMEAAMPICTKQYD